MGWMEIISGKIPARHLLCFMLFLGFMVTFLLRVNINLAVVVMVNMTVVQNFGNESSEVHGAKDCPSSHRTINTSQEESRVKVEDIGEFQWNEFQQGIILSSFFWGYLFFQIPGGRIAELWGTKTVFGASVLMNGVLALMLPIAARTHWILLLGIRALQGLGQGVVFPCLAAAVARWVPVAERARFISFAIQGCSLGQVVALPLCGWILATMGWPAVFYVSGFLGIVWYFAWYFLVFDSPDEHPRISLKEKQFLEKHIQKMESVKTGPVPWLSILTSWQFWVGAIASIGSDWGYHTFCNFGPKYMKNALGFDLEQLSGTVNNLCGWPEFCFFVPFTRTFLTLALASAYALKFKFVITEQLVVKSSIRLAVHIFSRIQHLLRLVAQTERQINYCEEIFSYCLTRKYLTRVSDIPYETFVILFIILLPANLFPAFGLVALCLTGCHVILSVAILTFSITMLGALSSGFFQNPLDIAPNYAGSQTGITNAMGAMTAVISTPLAGAILQADGSLKGWYYIFYISSGVYFLASLPYLLSAKIKLEPWNNLSQVNGFSQKEKRIFCLKEISTNDSEMEEDTILTTRN